VNQSEYKVQGSIS